jgi:hypothetical protein
MAAVAYARPPESAAEQTRLFAVPGIDAPSAPVPTPVAAPRRAGLAVVPAPESTLDALVTGRWSDLVLGASTECPLCEGTMVPRWSAGAGVVGGRCSDCGTTLE